VRVVASDISMKFKVLGVQDEVDKGSFGILIGQEDYLWGSFEDVIFKVLGVVLLESHFVSVIDFV
jgi:hypothetical protein